ncbi:lipase family protein [Nocardia terpenica]|uniref:Lipase n=1 Tax=Nocardia terpenica TaxID=455432 RepID=A0A164JHH3_9NOCA|nr:lipase family protein [Nocardia terpenica]KZM70407.1 hypothetical protein AWN90_03755 [Nocardia terpenica]NQE91088.1 lipase [Nocardia terpenica]
MTDIQHPDNTLPSDPSTDTDSVPATTDDLYEQRVVEHGRQPGDLLRLRKVATPQLRDTADAWLIVYVSKDSFDEPIAVSGIVIVPDTAAALGAGPILVYDPPFHGLGGRCAPSQRLAAGDEPDAGRIDAALDRGWTVAVPDGEGFVAPGPHTFLAARAAGHTTLDMARAVRALPDIDADGPVLIWGYADGGRAAITAAELHPVYAPEVGLRGVAAGAVIADPAALATHIEHSPWAVLGLAGLVGLSRAYAHLPLRHVLTEQGREAAALAGELDAARLAERFPEPLGRWCVREDPWNDPMWRFVLGEERRGRTGPVVPVHLYHGLDDPVVPVEHGLRVYDTYDALDVDVSWRTYPTGHRGTAATAANEILTRLADDLHRPL